AVSGPPSTRANASRAAAPERFPFDFVAMLIVQGSRMMRGRSDILSEPSAAMQAAKGETDAANPRTSTVTLRYQIWCPLPLQTCMIGQRAFNASITGIQSGLPAAPKLGASLLSRSKTT